MAKTTLNETQLAPHSLSANDRKNMSLTGVEEVLFFDEAQVILKTSAGQMHISGKNLHVTSLLVQEGRVQLDGQIDAISYTDRGLRGRKSLRDLFK